MSLETTPRSNRLHIGIFGKTNSGKSSLLNALTNQQYAVVSPTAGTTTDPVYKAMEINGIGPVVFIDTAGFDDTGELGKLRMEKTFDAVEKTDIAIVLFSPTLASADYDFTVEAKWIEKLKAKNIPFIPILNKSDLILQEQKDSLISIIKEVAGEDLVIVSALNKVGIENVYEALIRSIPKDFASSPLTGSLCKEGSLVLLVMPQDIQAPKGRLILPQVQILRELLDKKSIAVCCTTDKIDECLKAFSKDPDLIIADSQVFKIVYEKKPKKSLLTSFSVLMAASKGDINAFTEGATAIETLKPDSKVLIAEACTHAPLTEDIGREKIPKMLKKFVRDKYGDVENLKIDIAAGSDFPESISNYDLIIHCGACMFNRAYVLSRQEKVKQAKTSMTNYGIAIAYLTGILDKISVP